MPRTLLFSLLLPFSLPLPFAGAAHAQGAALDPVVVSATRTERPWLDVPASVDLVDGNTVRDAQLRVNLSESLGRVAGLVILNRQNYAQDLQISVRGFGARSTFGVRGVRLYVDGVPATSPDGQGQVSHFPLNATEKIEVLRGPFSALYGNSSGGVIALTTTLAPRPLRAEASVAAGSNDTWRAGVDLQGGTAPLAYALDTGRFSTDGSRDHSAATRDSLNLRVGVDETPLGRVRLALNSVAMPDAQDPLGLTREQYEANPEQASPQALQFNTRKTTRQTTFGGEVRTPLTQQAALTTSAWIGTRSVEQFQAIPVVTQLPPNHPGGVIDFDREFGGADVRATIDHGIFSTTFGMSGERLDEDRRGYDNFIGVGA
jgi:iron complex outermembrane receptor protein